MMSSEKKYDVVIAGAGMIGLSLAALLSKHQFSVAVIESKETPPETAALTARVCAIHENSAALFRHLGIWDTLPKSPMTEMHIWDASQQSALDFSLNNTAWIIENRAIQQALQTQGTWDYYHPHHPISFSDNGALILDDQTCLHTALLVGADGAHSWVREQMQASLHQKSYEQKAIIAVIESDQPHDQIANQKFLATGPVALLPLANPLHTALVWSADSPESDRLMQLSDTDFSMALTQALDHHCGQLRIITQRHQFPLIRREIDNYVDHRIALVGDAAHTIHPLAGLGANLGFMDVAMLAETLIKSRKEKKPLHDHRILRGYARCRKAENKVIIDAMGFLKEIFATQNAAITMGRNIVVNRLNQSIFFKNVLLKLAKGENINLLKCK